MANHGYVLDVSGYQPQATYYNFWQKWKARGVKGAIVKLSESTTYRNPYGAGQIAAAKHEGMAVSGYHFSRFRGNSYQAVSEAHYAIATANSMGLPRGSVIVLDYEERLGARGTNTQAAIAFLKCIKAAGFVPVFYSYSGMANLWDYNAIYQQTGAMLWIAAYPTMSGVTSPNMGYFPSISDHTGAWQFTDNFYGEHIDGSIDLTGVFTGMTEQQKPTSGGNLDSFHFDGDKLVVEGWFASNSAKGKDFAYVIITSDDERTEYVRQKVDLADRPDVAKAYQDVYGSGKCGFKASFEYDKKLAGKKLDVIFRYTNDSAGNGNATDYVVTTNTMQSASCLDSISTIVYTNKLRVSGWFASDLSVGLDNRFLILYDVDKKQELQRIKVAPVKREDVKKVKPAIYNADNSGFTGEFNYDASLVGRKLQVIARYSDDEHGEGKQVDYWFEPFNGPAMPVLDGKTETAVMVHSFTASDVKDGLIQLKFK